MSSAELLFLLTDDEDILLLSSIDRLRRRRESRPKFLFHQHDADRFQTDFRFSKDEVLRLKRAFDIPDLMRTDQGLLFSGLEGMRMRIRISAYELS